jgi:DNA-binding FadR family transcriptional regulator
MAALPIDLDRAARTRLATQIYRAVRDASETGRLDPGAKLPAWCDMAAQLGVSRGTVRVAYQRLIDEQFAVGAGAAGTRVVKWRRRCAATGKVRPLARAQGIGIASSDSGVSAGRWAVVNAPG